MGFPDSFLIPVSDTRAYKQFGNSVVVPLVTEIARAMQPLIATGANHQPARVAQDLM
jgi:DNA (cytosine-5)-methyltransferase 1